MIKLSEIFDSYVLARLPAGASEWATARFIQQSTHIHVTALIIHDGAVYEVIDFDFSSLPEIESNNHHGGNGNDRPTNNQ